ncbi:MAG: aspartate aminotransferase family protein [SAR324 cluster bacterium]|nr:aspartate aminotransferase family protein [SAR324 cluster bacterium]
MNERSAHVKAAHEEYIFPCAKPLYDEPIVAVEAKGVKLIDAEGDEYLDLIAGILTTSIGHCHPVVIDRVSEQMKKLGHTSTLYITENQVNAGKELASIAPGKLKSTFFTNSGTEAVETAITLAQCHTDRQEIIVLRNGYSGRSVLASNMTGHGPWRPTTSVIPFLKYAMSPYPYRSPFDPEDEKLGEKMAQDIEDVIRTTTNGKPAAFFAETIQGVGGFVVPPKGYFQKAAEIIRSYGGLFISDEVQAGFGRTGDKWFGIEHWGVEPDIMVMAKGIANGAPVGATITRPEIAASWTAKTFSTYGGNPISMAAMEATLEVMKQENTPALSAKRGKQLRAGLDALYQKYHWIGEVRGMGLMQGIELVEDRNGKTPSPAKAKAFIESAKAEKLLVGAGGLDGHVIRIAPSMLISEAETDDAIERLNRTCQRVNDM